MLINFKGAQFEIPQAHELTIAENMLVEKLAGASIYDLSSTTRTAAAAFVGIRRVRRSVQWAAISEMTLAQLMGSIEYDPVDEDQDDEDTATPLDPTPPSESLPAASSAVSPTADTSTSPGSSPASAGDPGTSTS